VIKITIPAGMSAGDTLGLLTPEEAARVLEVNPRTVYNRCNAGSLFGVKEDSNDQGRLYIPAWELGQHVAPDIGRPADPEIVVVSVAGHDRHYFRNTERAEAWLTAAGARYDERIGWYTTDVDGDIDINYDLDVVKVK
jgi:hypothetical protein